MALIQLLRTTHTEEPAMTHAAALTSLPPVILVHLAFATSALALGPVALTVRKGTPLHRGVGYAWVTVMLGAALSSLLIHDFGKPNIGGYTLIHLLAFATFAGVGRAIWYVMNHRIAAHRKTMLWTYLGACIGAGLVTLIPGRYLGDLLWHHALGLV